MSEKIKNYLGVAIIIALLCLAGVAIAYVNSYVKNTEPASFRTFAATGEGKAVGVPDVAEFSFQVITEGGKDVAALQKQNSDKVNQALSYVKSQGVDPKDIKTIGYDLSPRYQYFNCTPQPLAGGEALRPCPPAEIAGYTVIQTVDVKARKFDKVGGLLSGVVTAGANSVSQLTFKVDDPTQIQSQARAEAFAKARATAEALAAAGGFRLGRLVAIEEGGNPVLPMYNNAALGKGGGPAPEVTAAPNVEPGSQEITVDLTLRYEIK